MKTFPELPDDARAEWREDPVTQAFIAWLSTTAASDRSVAFDELKSAEPNYHNATLHAGASRALSQAVDIATRETFE